MLLGKEKIASNFDLSVQNKTSFCFELALSRQNGHKSTHIKKLLGVQFLRGTMETQEDFTYGEHNVPQ